MKPKKKLKHMAQAVFFQIRKYYPAAYTAVEVFKYDFLTAVLSYHLDAIASGEAVNR